MNELMIIILGLAVIRTITPFTDKENYTFPKITVAVLTTWAYIHLLSNCMTITF